ncbi:LptF/LptG family permease [Algibacter miyuki]|uniref:LptF/LptG family permease n=1 Tax=Algibacter miyuki TaxID=1306933 RepID=A0ABV5H048_9FLAO|nr:LptF/LptG family permease [Algibacter miyuki]MDN3667540.1 LptF/LptG family permease [Algibacter miyuki]
MKILDRYILTTYLKTFFSVFIILMLIFVLQTIWLYIKELAGKDLNIVIIAKFLVYFMPKLIPLVLPLTILLSSIMVFGSFAENYEFAAMKSTGISLQRAMSGLSVFIIGLGIVTFFFANNVIPWAEINSYNLRKNIAKMKPAAFIAEGQFNQMGEGFNIKVEKKTGETGQYLEDVTIHKQSGKSKNKYSTIVSETGELVSNANSDVLKLVLYNGYYYDDNPSDNRKNIKKAFVKSAFTKYIINIDLSDFNKVDLDEQSQTDKYSMLDVVDLNTAMDSLVVKQQKEYQGVAKNLVSRSSINNVFRNIKTNKIPDTIYTGPLLDTFETQKKLELIDLTLKAATSAKQTLSQKINTYNIAKSNFNRHVISFHEKFALGIACIILFFVGAPLGALIRKGGIGLPMVIAILIFLSYHFIGIFAVNSAKTGNFNPVLASWFSTLIMLPLGVFLTKRATADKGLVDMGSLIAPLKKIFKIKEKDESSYKFLEAYKQHDLIDVIKNYDTLGHDENTRFEALNLLKLRGQSIEELQQGGLDIDASYNKSEQIHKDYKDHAKFAIFLYSIGAVLLLLFFVFKNNKLPSVASASIQLSLVSFALFIVYYIKSIINIIAFYKHIDNPAKRPNWVLLIIGLPLYMIAYPLLNVNINEDLKRNCLKSLK